MTINTEITSTRYDLRDELSTQYSDTLLLNYFNRALRVLNSYLADFNSDWVLSLDSTTLLDGDNSIVLPGDFLTPRKVTSGTSNVLEKKNALEMLETQTEGYTGPPEYYAIHKTNMIFDKEVSADIVINTYYNLKADTLVIDAAMPFEEQFNDSLRGVVVMMAKSRNSRDVVQDYAIYQFFQTAEAGKNLRRKYSPKVKTRY